MRIRKHAKISPLIYTTASNNSSSSLNQEDTILSTKLVCQLNQSPWDIITFSSNDSPTLYLSSQFNGYDSYNENGTLNDSNGAIESVRSIKLDMMKWDNNNIEKKHNEVVENGNYSLSPKKQPAKDSVSCRGRPHLKKSSSPDELFYYYSGFGPSWSKKRGGGSSRKNGALVENVESHNNNVTISLSQMDNEELDYIEDEDDEESMKKRARKPIKARSLKSLM